MTTKTLLGLQLKRLLSGLSDHGTQHLTEIETDLMQTSFLLGEAIEKLGASFMAMHEAISAQQETVNALLATAPPNDGLGEKLKAGQAEISRHINAAVTGLQFQDMTSQLINRTVQRINGLRELLGAVGGGSAGVPANSDVSEVIAALDSISARLEEQSARLESGLWKAVHQTHMESGDIELF